MFQTNPKKIGIAFLIIVIKFQTTRVGAADYAKIKPSLSSMYNGTEITPKGQATTAEAAKLRNIN